MDTILSRCDFSAKAPKYRAVADAIRAGIGEGALAPGDKLPPVRSLAWDLKITPGTVARAYTILTEEGVLSAEVGRGTFVAHPRRPLPPDVWSPRTPPQEAEVLNLFSPHLPDVGQVDAIREALAAVGQADPERLLSYPTRDAYRPVRQAVADWLAEAPLGRIGEEDVVLAHGGQNALMLVLQAVLRGPRPVILVEELSYAGFRRAAEVLRAEVVSVEMDDQGVLPEALEAAARSTGAQVFCTTPEVQNPTLRFTPAERRQALADVAARLDLQILEDDCYRIAHSRAPGYRQLAPERGWYVTSLSKSLTPALRVGFAVAPRGQGALLRQMAEYGFFGLAQPLAELVERLLPDPRTRVLCGAVQARVGEYVRIAVNALGAHDLHWHPEVPFLWLHLPPGWRAAAFSRAALAEGIQIRSADEFALRDGRAPHAVRISVNARVSPEAFEAAMQRLNTLLRNPPEQISV